MKRRGVEVEKQTREREGEGKREREKERKRKRTRCSRAWPWPTYFAFHRFLPTLKHQADTYEFAVCLLQRISSLPVADHHSPARLSFISSLSFRPFLSCSCSSVISARKAPFVVSNFGLDAIKKKVKPWQESVSAARVVLFFKTSRSLLARLSPPPTPSNLFPLFCQPPLFLSHHDAASRPTTSSPQVHRGPPPWHWDVSLK